MTTDIPQSVQVQRDLTLDHIDRWLKDVLQPEWWVLVGLIIVCIVVWVVLLDKKRLRETLLYAAFLSILGLGMAEYGEELILWDYPVDLIAVFPPLTSINLLLLPLSYSLAYQYCNTSRLFFAAVLGITTVLCFVIEPLLSTVDLYNLINWQYWWSFPFYAASALLVRKITVMIFSIEKRAQEGR